MKKLLIGFIFMAVLFVIPSNAQAVHSVALSWPASVSTGVTGYNVYRFVGACPAQVTLNTFTKLTNTGSTLAYTDTSVTAGSIYCYVITAVNATSESAASGTLQATIPIFTASTTPVPPASINETVQ
jgi:hypothetical protein